MRQYVGVLFTQGLDSPAQSQPEIDRFDRNVDDWLLYSEPSCA